MEIKDLIIRTGLIALGVVFLLDLLAFLMLMNSGVNFNSILVFTAVFSAIIFPMSVLGVEFYSQASYMQIDNKLKWYLLLAIVPPAVIGLIVFLITLIINLVTKTA